MRRLVAADSLLLFLFATGCAQYHEKPLSHDVIESRLNPPIDQELSVATSKLKHPILRPLPVDFTRGITPSQAAVVAVVLNPMLVSARSQRATAEAQLLQAGILPNPQLVYEFAHPIGGGVLAGTNNGFSVGFDWDVQELISQGARVDAAKAEVKSVQLDIGWQEWQTAEVAEQAALDVLAAESQRQADDDVARRLLDNFNLVRTAVDQHQKTLLDLAGAESAYRDASAIFLQARRDENHSRLMLNRALGLPPDTRIRVVNDNGQTALPSRYDPPAANTLIDGLEDRRLDLLALKLGYESQEQTLRAAVLAQFPKLNLGLSRATDTTNVHSLNFGFTMDIPIFDRNQGAIAAETATRQRLFDEYTQRIFEARSDIALAIDSIQAVNAQIADAEAAMPGLQRLVDTYKSSSQQGNVDVLSYYGAQIQLAQKSVAILQLKQQLADLRIALQTASGQFLPEPEAAATESNQTPPIQSIGSVPPSTRP
ncbi:MAG: TolC family protein [Phycisphaerae bacterium]|nr:TolC family protein [Phycisphaerae bacterium]